MNIEDVIPYQQVTADQLTRTEWGPGMVLIRHQAFGFHATPWDLFHRDYRPIGYRVVLTTEQVRAHLAVDLDRGSFDGRERGMARLLARVLDDHPREPGRVGFFQSWRCNCTQIAGDWSELHSRCPAHGAESLVSTPPHLTPAHVLPFPLAFGVQAAAR